MKHFKDMITTDPSGQGDWVDLKAPNQIWDTVNVHLRPGYIVPLQENYEQKFKTTGEITNIPLAIVINRDPQGHA